MSFHRELNERSVDPDRVGLRLAFLEDTKQFSGGLLEAQIGRRCGMAISFNSPQENDKSTDFPCCNPFATYG
ncbi:hypothetical protein DNX69_11875 [Rhodopseudomonas palustris]|uniref:Uncharacterized protein n=1 Tax=Rhodopseudomonas palustris TaxID=1076 RepID=A0A323UJM5_RHOPL|nr:hypothetical protein [Rhodopseudomonas palustris]PZA11800.1 hypothetical protein DNX69_11875 [Rhodopseudomonas palustris]